MLCCLCITPERLHMIDWPGVFDRIFAGCFHCCVVDVSFPGGGAA
jgi:hypothetical protein